MGRSGEKVDPVNSAALHRIKTTHALHIASQGRFTFPSDRKARSKVSRQFWTRKLKAEVSNF